MPSLVRIQPCPHCNFVPANEAVSQRADARLQALDEEIDSLVDAWTKRLLADLEDPTAVQNRKLLGKDAQKLVTSFVEEKVLPEDLTPAFLTAIRDALAGLKGVELRLADFAAAMGSTPVTVSEAKERFDALLAALTKGLLPGL